MQISTRDEDWIVEPFELRDELEDLNEVFTNPDIVKVRSIVPDFGTRVDAWQVLHGAESDVVWLQQDFNLYLVNMFDTFHASKVLDFSRHGLATLLEMYCDFSPDKRYQLADWRIRYVSPFDRVSASFDTASQTFVGRDGEICARRYPFPSVERSYHALRRPRFACILRIHMTRREGWGSTGGTR